MKVIQKQIGEGKVRLEAHATPQEVDQVLNAAQKGFAASMGLKTEKGKSVAQVAEEQLGIKNLDSVVESTATELFVPFALDKQNIAPAFPPSTESKSPLKRGREYTFTLNVTLKPEYELSSYDPVTINLAPFEVTEEAVDEQLAMLAKNYTTYKTAEPKPLETGDCCKLAMQCFIDGEELKALTTPGRTYVLGENFLPESFDEQIIGMQPGETKTFTFEGPGYDDEGNEITQTIECTATINEIQEAVEPEMDDEWVKLNMPMYKDYKSLRGAVAESLESEGRVQYEDYKRQLALNELTRRFEGRIPDEFYEATRSSLIGNIQSDLQQQNMTWEDFINQNGGEQQLGMMLMMQAREILLQGFCLDAVYRHEHLKLTDADIEAACISMNPNMDPKEVRRQFEESGRGFALRESAERYKANRWVVDHAIINDNS